MIGPADFTEADDGGAYLTRRALRQFVAQFGRRLNTTVYHPDAGRALSYQKVFEVQARRLRKCIESGEPAYQPFLAK
jgi:CRISPR/Cas system-associated endonuclease Cas1